jgi:hypothetical protein
MCRKARGSLQRPLLSRFERERIRFEFEVSHNHLSVEKSNPGSFYNFRYMAPISFAGHLSRLAWRTPLPMGSHVEFPLTPISPLVRLTHFVTRAISRFNRFWPLAGVGFAVIINVVWLGFLGVEFLKLIEAAFF